MRAVVSLSGGLDSTVLAHHLHARGELIECVAVDYGQRHRVELRYASAIAARLGVPFTVVDLSGLASTVMGDSSQTDPNVPVPHGHYADASMRVTVVPNRNMMLLAVATATAITAGGDAVAYAAHAGDHAIYPDCRPEFADAMAQAMALAHYTPITLARPFIGWSKADIVREGARLGVPFAETWSCYEGGTVHCGQCGTCVERREAFLLAGVPDPTPYAVEA